MLTYRLLPFGILSITFVLATASCDLRSVQEPKEPEPTTVADSLRAARSLEALRARFRVSSLASREIITGEPTSWPSIGPSAATRLERVGDRLPVQVRDSLGSSHPATLTMPARANGAFELVDRASGVSTEVAVAGARNVDGEVADGIVIYGEALPGGVDLVQRPVEGGVEDYLFFARRPPSEEVRYEVALGPKVAGLRLVADTLEFLDEGGTPRLRMAPPSIQDARGDSHPVRIELSGCNVDTNPAGPWDRRPIPPGSRRCVVRLDFRHLGLSYPVLVDPAWVTTGSMTPRALHIAVRLGNGRVLSAGGVASTQLAVAELYDPTTGTWAATGGLAAARYEHTATLLANGKVLVASGQGTSALLTSAELYDAAVGTWTSANNLAIPRRHHTAVLLPNGKVLVASGQVTGGSYSPGVEVYDPVTNVWSSTGSLTSGRRWHTASLLSTGVIVAGGASNQPFATVEQYNVATGQWTAASSMASARYNHTATVLANGKLLVAGGSPAGAKSEVYDPATNQWAPTGDMVSARLLHNAVLVPDGRVLAIGGIASFTTAEFYSLTTGTWSSAPTMSVGHFYHTSTLLDDGSVLVAGGYPSQSTPPTGTSERLFDLPAGAACTTATSAQCSSGICADGVCCNVACDGVCLACNLPATRGVCSPTTGDSCSDGNACSQGDTCQAGACVGTPVICPAIACRAPGTCDADGGACSEGVRQADGTPCDGGLCSAGACMPSATEDAGSDAGDTDSGAEPPDGGTGGCSSSGVITTQAPSAGWLCASCLALVAMARRRRAR